MGERNHLSVPGTVGQPKGRWSMLLGGTVVAILAAGFLMQYVRSPASKAASEPAAGQARVGAGAKKPEVLARVADDSITYDAVAEECVKRFGREVLDDLIHRLIIQQACEERQINVTEQEISDEIGRIAKRFNLDVNQWLHDGRTLASNSRNSDESRNHKYLTSLHNPLHRRNDPSAHLQDVFMD